MKKPHKKIKIRECNGQLLDFQKAGSRPLNLEQIQLPRVTLERLKIPYVQGKLAWYRKGGYIRPVIANFVPKGKHAEKALKYYKLLARKKRIEAFIDTPKTSFRELLQTMRDIKNLKNLVRKHITGEGDPFHFCENDMSEMSKYTHDVKFRQDAIFFMPLQNFKWFQYENITLKLYRIKNSDENSGKFGIYLKSIHEKIYFDGAKFVPSLADVQKKWRKRLREQFELSKEFYNAEAELKEIKKQLRNFK